MSGPPDKFESFPQTKDPQADIDTMNEFGSQGYTRVECVLDYGEIGKYIVMGGYKGSGS